MTTLFLAGDVMTGRGIDSILPHPGDPQLREAFLHDAAGYVRLAEAVNGPIPRPVPFDWPWGDALALLDRRSPAVRLVNLETAITRGGQFAPGKAVCYRMSPANVPCLLAARLDVCVLANNHILDFGRAGLLDTIRALTDAGIAVAGAGADIEQARRPAVVDLPGGGGRAVILAAASPSAGVPLAWAATGDRPGVNLIAEDDDTSADDLVAQAAAARRPGDIVAVSVHWGKNWGHHIPDQQIAFAHRLVDGGVDLVYGHSSHHPRALEVYRDHLILYGCGDLINDYEGIVGDPATDAFRDDLHLLYFADVDPDTGRLASLAMDAVRSRRMRLEQASDSDAEWLGEQLAAAGRHMGTR
ncbi:poly-gamma-glutamate capsule biosynthesis protein CapA/YwtB (metallophosphatase superfamily) [Catenulispora sp. GP43]|uniref:CapA family protein n=1 Tax=Catenulispora sp. GP43 TaxID=3156263 RepID=UPI003511AF92